MFDKLMTLWMLFMLRLKGAKLSGLPRASGLPPCIRGSGSFNIGRGVIFRSRWTRVLLKAVGDGSIEIGERTFVNNGVTLYSEAAIAIGAHSRIGDFCMLYDTSFHAVHEGQVARPKPITLGRNVWLGRGVIVLPGVTIGDHSVVAAGSVVFDDIPARQLWRGNPAVYHRNVTAGDDFVRR